MKRFALFFCAANLTVPTQALAQDYRLQPFGGASVIIVWKSKEASSEGMQLIQAGVHRTRPEMVQRLISCIVPGGTKVVVTDMGFVTHDILVVDGNYAGCRGNVAAEELKTR